MFQNATKIAEDWKILSLPSSLLFSFLFSLLFPLFCALLPLFHPFPLLLLSHLAPSVLQYFLLLVPFPLPGHLFLSSHNLSVYLPPLFPRQFLQLLSHFLYFKSNPTQSFLSCLSKISSSNTSFFCSSLPNHNHLPFSISISGYSHFLHLYFCPDRFYYLFHRFLSPFLFHLYFFYNDVLPFFSSNSILLLTPSPFFLSLSLLPSFLFPCLSPSIFFQFPHPFFQLLNAVGRGSFGHR